MQQNQHKPNRKLWILCHLSVVLLTIWVTGVSNTKVTKLVLGLYAFVGSEKVLVLFLWSLSVKTEYSSSVNKASR